MDLKRKTGKETKIEKNTRKIKKENKNNNLATASFATGILSLLTIFLIIVFMPNAKINFTLRLFIIILPLCGAIISFILGAVSLYKKIMNRESKRIFFPIIGIIISVMIITVYFIAYVVARRYLGIG